MNRKGQALIEFVLILPVFLFLIFAIYDFGMIFTNKNSLENDSIDIVNLFRAGTSLDEISELYPKIDIAVTNDNDYYKISANTSIKLITPGFNRLFGEPYVIYVERFIPYV